MGLLLALGVFWWALCIFAVLALVDTQNVSAIYERACPLGKFGATSLPSRCAGILI